MKRIIDIKSKKGENNCTIAAINNILSFYGVNMREYETFIISDGFDTSYNDGYVAINSLKKINNSLNNYKKFNTEYIDLKKDDKNKVICAVSEGIPVIAMINSNFLNFNPKLEKKYEFFRSFIIYGIDTEKEILKIYDLFFINENQMVDTLSFEINIEYFLNNAEESIIFYPLNKGQLDYRIETQLLLDLEKYINSKYSKSNNRINSIIYHKKQLEEIFKSGNEEALLKACYYTSSMIRFGTFMPMMSYLINYFEANSYKYSEVDKILEKLKSLKIEWNILSNKAIKITLAKKQELKSNFIVRYSSIFRETIELIEEIIEIINNSLGKGIDVYDKSI